MAVHAHPDDEASRTGGDLGEVLGRRGSDGACYVHERGTGDSPSGGKPGDDGHDESAVVDLRRRELEDSCRILGVDHLEMLGYHDSGMMGWPNNDRAGGVLGDARRRGGAPARHLMERYRPDVVVTYDDFGFYGHPDHIQAHRITLAALDITGLPAKLYCPTVRRSALPLFAERMEQAGLEPPSFDLDRFGSPDEDVAASIDCREYATAKLDALAAHASQQDNIFFLRIPLPDFTEMFGREEFIRLRDPTNSAHTRGRPVHGPPRHLNAFHGKAWVRWPVASYAETLTPNTKYAWGRTCGIPQRNRRDNHKYLVFANSARCPKQVGLAYA